MSKDGFDCEKITGYYFLFTQEKYNFFKDSKPYYIEQEEIAIKCGYGNTNKNYDMKVYPTLEEYKQYLVSRFWSKDNISYYKSIEYQGL